MKKPVALVLGAVLLAALLFSAMAGCGGKEAPAEKIDKAIQKTNDIKSVHADYDVKLDIKGDASALGPEMKGLLPLSLSINGGADIDNHSDKVKAKGNVKMEGLDKIFQSLAGAQGGLDAQTMLGVNMIGNWLSDMEFVLLDEKAYIKMGGTWYETDASSVGDIANVGDITSSASGINQDCLRKAIQDPGKFGAGKTMTDIQELSEEKVNGADTRHFKAGIDLDKALTEMANAMRDCGDAEGAGGLEAGKSELSKMFKTKDIELWIDNDNNLVQVKIDIELDPAALTNAAGALSGAGTSPASGLESISISMRLTMSDFNKDMSISKPEGNIMKLEDLFGAGGGLGSGLLGGGGQDGLGTGSSSGTSTTGGTGTTGGTSTRSSSASSNTSSYSR